MFGGMNRSVWGYEQECLGVWTGVFGGMDRSVLGYEQECFGYEQRVFSMQNQNS